MACAWCREERKLLYIGKLGVLPSEIGDDGLEHCLQLSDCGISIDNSHTGMLYRLTRTSMSHLNRCPHPRNRARRVQTVTFDQRDAL